MLSNVPEFTELVNWPPNSPDLNPVDYSVLSLQNFRHWSAEASSDRLLGSAKPGHTEPSDWSDAKKDWRWLSRQRAVMLNFVWTNHSVRDRPCFTVFRMKIEQKSCIIVKFNAILGYWRFMQIRQRIFNCTDMQIKHIILDKILKLLTC